MSDAVKILATNARSLISLGTTPAQKAAVLALWPDRVFMNSDGRVPSVWQLRRLVAGFHGSLIAGVQGDSDPRIRVLEESHFRWSMGEISDAQAAAQYVFSAADAIAHGGQLLHKEQPAIQPETAEISPEVLEALIQGVYNQPMNLAEEDIRRQGFKLFEEVLCNYLRIATPEQAIEFATQFLEHPLVKGSPVHFGDLFVPLLTTSIETRYPGVGIRTNTSLASIPALQELISVYLKLVPCLSSQEIRQTLICHEMGHFIGNPIVTIEFDALYESPNAEMAHASLDRFTGFVEFLHQAMTTFREQANFSEGPTDPKDKRDEMYPFMIRDRINYYLEMSEKILARESEMRRTIQTRTSWAPAS